MVALPGIGVTAGSENALQVFMNSLPDAIFICLPDQTIVEVNDVGLRLYGVSRERALGLPIGQDFISRDGSPRDFREIWDEAVLGNAQCFEWKARRPGDGSVFDAELFIRSAKLDDGDNYLILSVRDLTLPRTTECVLRGSQATYVEMVQCINGIILQVDKEGKIRFINRFAQEFFGYSDQEILGRNVIGTILPETSTSGQDLSTLILRIIQNPDQYIYNENENMRRNGERVWIAWTNKALVNNKGDVAALLCTGINITDLKHRTEDLRRIRDHLEITVKERTAALIQTNDELLKENSERKEAEKALRESERKSRAIFDQTYEFIGLITPDGRLIEANRTAMEFIGVKESDVMGRLFWDTPWWTHSINIQEKLRTAVNNAAAGRFERFEVTHKAKDGSLHIIDFSLKPVVNETGKVDLIIPEGRDITERKQIEEELRKSEANLARAQWISSMGNWEWLIDKNEIICSDEVYWIFGLNRDDVPPSWEMYLSCVHPDDLDVVISAINGALDDNKPYSHDYRIIRPDGSERYLHGEGQVTGGSDDLPARLFGVVQDITDRKQIELQLEKAKHQAELYVDLMGHDINNMNQMGIGYLELAIESADPEKIRELITMSLSMLRGSSRLIGNVEKLQRVTAGTVKHEAIDVGQVLTETISLYSSMPGREITINYEQMTRCIAVANELVKEVFSNILANAVKFSTGTLTINVKLDRVRADGSDYCRVAIEDNGPGIRDEIKCGLFTRFKRGETKARGRGLGLYLVKAIVDSFHGHVYVEDRVPGDYSGGSRFMILLPVVGQGQRV